MRLDGALKPRGAPTFGRSVGAERHQPNRKSVKSNESKRQIAAANVKTLCSVIHNFHDLYKKVINTKSKASKNENSTNVVEYFTLQEEGESRDVKNNNQSPIKLFSAGGDQKKVERKKAAIKMAPPKVTLGDDTNSRGAATKLLHFVAKLVRVRKSLATATNNADDCGLRFVRRRGYVSTLTTFALCLFFVFILLPNEAICDEGDNGFFVNTFSMGPETTTPEFDYASRGKKKFGDKCDNTLECGFPGSICDVKKKSCQCTEDLPITNHIDKCGKEAAVNESCFFNEQCESFYFQTECRDGRCICRFDMTPLIGKDGVFECKGRGEKPGPGTYIDPAMIGVLVAMAVMFIIICVVLRLFSQARWRENRTIFNTPNPRLMNVSLLRDSKLLHGQERRGSRMSVRAPSRQPSMASLRPHSPNPSLGSHGSGSNASATSVRSVRSNSVAPGHVVNSNHDRKGSAPHHHHHQHQHQHHHQQQQQQQQPLITNITPNPVADNVTVEIIKPEK